MTVFIGILTFAALLGAPIEGVDTPPTTQEPPDALAYGDEGAWVAELNDQLEEAGFHPDGDAKFGRRTRHAVFAFQKHHVLPTTGSFTSEMWDLLEEPITLPARPERNRVEVDLGKQVLYLVDEGRVELVLPVSSASGGTYRHSSGSLTRAATPEGKFEFERRVRGWRRSYLGSLYNPYYFRGGYAIHGSSSVPNYPASHGCIRLTMWDMDLVKTKIDLGLTIYVYGKRTEPPEPYTIANPRPVAL